jgi:hypothetical protein
MNKGPEFQRNRLERSSNARVFGGSKRGEQQIPVPLRQAIRKRTALGHCRPPSTVV